MNTASPKLKPRVLWREDETRILLKSWKNHLYIYRLIKKGCSKDPLYYAISKDLQKYGFDRSIKEVMFKTKNLLRRKAGSPYFKYNKEVDEIERMSSRILPAGEEKLSSRILPAGEEKLAAEPQIVHTIEQDEIVLDESFLEGIDSEQIQVIRLGVPDQDIANSSASSCPIIVRSEPEVQNEREGSKDIVTQAESSSSKKTPENILLSFFQEFERSNRQLEKNDAAMLELFREQNDIFRTQTTLLMKLLLKE